MSLHVSVLNRSHLEFGTFRSQPPWSSALIATHPIEARSFLARMALPSLTNADELRLRGALGQYRGRSALARADRAFDIAVPDRSGLCACPMDPTKGFL